ncbi:HipA N-terminal domain-containing protein [Hymenobacter aerophilus]|uniref:HipA N-terminal domain-containing protein n=1 Tax=Hymenobacter aerophilus TaxID=119644 RepID=UPI0003769F8A|nr:HipA N-terminal domain-containing protein [Hymenobacter aerophilus]
MRQAEVRMYNQVAGYLTQDEQGYTFAYAPAYLQDGAGPISLTLPLREQPYVALVLFPFFDGLIPEGWLLDVAERNWKLNTRDRMGLLLACCQDCIGAVSIYPLPASDDDA